MLTNPHTGTRIDEVAPGIYRGNGAGLLRELAAILNKELRAELG